jgi:hypothetical protein
VWGVLGVDGGVWGAGEAIVKAIEKAKIILD